MEERYRAMLMARSGEERLQMGDSMYATARALVIASIMVRDPSISPAALRQAVFLRFYGHEFDAATRERILRRLAEPKAAGEAEERPRRTQVPVDWDDLGTALTTNSGEWSCYFDLRSGEVHMVPGDRLVSGADWPSEEDIDEELAAGHLIHIEPLGSSVEYGWMAEFAATVGDARLRDRLEVALDGRGAFRRFKNVLSDSWAERDRWFAFRDQRLHAAAREWLEEQGIGPTTKPREERPAHEENL
jgi:hypothetical protein